MENLYKRWKATPEKFRKTVIFVLGFIIVGIGIVDLPLPGPGWVIIFFGFAILASEFAFAERVRNKLVHALKELIKFFERTWHRLRQGFGKWLQS